MSEGMVVASFMEPKPTKPGSFSDSRKSPLGWWRWRYTMSGKWAAVPNDDKTDSLDALREVEARLTAAQWRKYIDTVVPVRGNIYEECKSLIHADAPTKLRALASVLPSEGKS